MSVLPKLATSLGIRNEEPNKALANEIVKNNDKKAIKELVENLSNKDRNIQADCIKTLYEAGEQKPELIAEYDEEFLRLLDSKFNRLVWGAMCALDCIAGVNPVGIYAKLPKIIHTMDNGTVITKDHGISILSKLGKVKAYTDDCLTLMLENLLSAPINQFPAYSEKTATIINAKHKPEFKKILESRLETIDIESKRKRIEKVLKKLG